MSHGPGPESDPESDAGGGLGSGRASGSDPESDLGGGSGSRLASGSDLGDDSRAGPEGPRRADAELVRRGLARSRAQARAWIDAGEVTLDGQPVRKSAQLVPERADLQHVGEAEVWVSRAAYKLMAALDAFEARGLSVAGARCLDVGASTGGFTQVLLRRGAAAVVALDVGHGQLAPAIAQDPRVIELSGRSVREVTAAEVGGPAQVVVADLSFISLRLVLGQLAELATPDGDVVALIKPQFEVGRERLGKGGVVRSGALRAHAVREVLEAGQAARLYPFGLVASPVTGSTGNQEYLVWLRREPEGMMSAMDLTRVLAQIDKAAW